MNEITPPMWLLAELTYRCPLQCLYCSNPIALGKTKTELTTEDWIRVMTEARELGALQIGFSGGEPLLRPDLIEIVYQARNLGFYTNLITSGIGADRTLIKELKDAGLDHIQVSFQSNDREIAEWVAGSGKFFDTKIHVARLVKELGYPLVFNCVIHKQNIHQIEGIIDFAHQLNADYVELANTQYHGWALKNLSSLLPTHEQIQTAFQITESCKKKYKDMEIIFVIPDYYEDRPKPCMQGLGSIFLTINPFGDALPCHSASILPMTFPNVKDYDIRSIWHDSDAFNYFRGFSWMKDPCKTCSEKAKDFGGCRCQAFALTGDMHNADPVCSKSYNHNELLQSIANSLGQNNHEPVYRNYKNSTP